MTPDKTVQHSQELIEAKSEILKLRAQLRRTEEERDILKKAAAYFAREPGYSTCSSTSIATSLISQQRIYKTRDLAKADIFDYIEMFYNRTRRHSHLGGISPEAFEAASKPGSGVS